MIHDIDVLRFVCGEIDSVQALTSSAGRGLPINDTAVVSVSFAGGALGTITMSDAVAAPWAWDLTSGENPFFGRTDENCYLLAGSEASLAVPSMRLWRYPGAIGWATELAEDRVPVATGDPYARQLAHFLAVIRGDERPVVGARDATATLAATLAVEEAAAAGHRIALSGHRTDVFGIGPGDRDQGLATSVNSAP